MVDFTTFDSEGFGDRIRDTRETFNAQNPCVKLTVKSYQNRRFKAIKPVGPLSKHSRENGRSDEENSFLGQTRPSFCRYWTVFGVYLDDHGLHGLVVHVNEVVIRFYVWK